MTGNITELPCCLFEIVSRFECDVQVAKPSAGVSNRCSYSWFIPQNILGIESCCHGITPVLVFLMSFDISTFALHSLRHVFYCSLVRIATGSKVDGFLSVDICIVLLVFDRWPRNNDLQNLSKNHFLCLKKWMFFSLSSNAMGQWEILSVRFRKCHRSWVSALGCCPH